MWLSISLLILYLAPAGLGIVVVGGGEVKNKNITC